MKGAPERVVERCSRLWAPAGPLSLDPAARAEFLALAEQGAADGLRVLALFWRALGRLEGEPEVSDLTLLGLVGLLDPARPGAVEAVERCRGAGIEVVMLTGDHARPAEAVARQVGLLNGGGAVLTGAELARLSGGELAQAVAATRVFARVTPEQKLALVRAFNAQGHVVAVTGDGVNDAPALKEAHIGIAMGRSGTEVAKEAVDVVLADDNFATIVAAVEEGRGIYFNLQRFIAYLLACKAGEVGLMLVSSLAGLPVPLMPSNLLLVNLVTDGLPALALGVGPAPRDLMHRRPREKGRGILDGGQWIRVLLAGAAFGVVALGVFALEIWRTGELGAGRTSVFASLAMSQLAYAFLLRRSAGGDLTGASLPVCLDGDEVLASSAGEAVRWVPALEELGIPFIKMHGLGNDYVFVDLYREGLAEPPWDPAEVSRAVSPRRTGVGSDGLILVLRGGAASLRMRVFNADGSEAEMCGNGIRCFAKYAFEAGYTGGERLFPVETGAGLVWPEVAVEGGVVRSVRVDMGPPRLRRADIPMAGPPDEPAVDAALSVEDRVVRVTSVSMGNPHCVVFVEEGAAPDVDRLGPLLERHPAFPRRTNVEFVRLTAPDRLVVDVWERGSGRTAACGTGACAAVVAGALTGRSARSATVRLPGGELAVEWAEDGHVYMAGPAVEVFRGVFAPR